MTDSPSEPEATFDLSDSVDSSINPDVPDGPPDPEGGPTILDEVPAGALAVNAAPAADPESAASDLTGSVNLRPARERQPFVLRPTDEVEQDVTMILTDPLLIAALRARDVARLTEFGEWRDGSKHPKDSGVNDALHKAIIDYPGAHGTRETLLLAIQTAEDKARTAIGTIAESVHYIREALVDYSHYVDLRDDHMQALRDLGLWDDERDAYETPGEPEAPAHIPDSQIL